MSTPGVYMDNRRITQLADPTGPRDASTRSYVDVSLNTAVASVKAYSDVSLNAAVVAVKAYSDVSLNAAVVAVKAYSDVSLNAAVVAVKAYSDVSLNAAVVAVKAYSDLSLNNAVSNVRMQVGDIKMSVRNDNHQGWLKCDGTAVSRSTYSSLFALVGTSFGIGDGFSTFHLPNAAGKVLGIASGSRALGSTAGSETHTLTTAEMPAHQHTYQDAYFAENTGGGSNNVFGTGASSDTDNSFRYRLSNGSYSNSPGDLLTSSQGSGTAFSVMQPTLFIGNTFIYAGVL